MLDGTQQPAVSQRRQRVSTGLSKKYSEPSADAECLRARLLILQAQEKEGQTCEGVEGEDGKTATPGLRGGGRGSLAGIRRAERANELSPHVAVLMNV